MAALINGRIFAIKYVDSRLVSEWVECSDETDLFNYLADKHINGRIVSSVKEICKDGTTPKVAVLTNKEYKKILRQYQNPTEIIVKESYYTNDRGCHYYLTPENEVDSLILPQFHTDTTSLKRAKAEAQEWIFRQENSIHIKIVVKRNK